MAKSKDNCQNCLGNSTRENDCWKECKTQWTFKGKCKK